MWIGFDPIQGTEVFHGTDAEYRVTSDLHERNAQHTRALMDEAARLGAILPVASEQFGTGGPTQYDVVDLQPIPRAEVSAPAVGKTTLRLAS